MTTQLEPVSLLVERNTILKTNLNSVVELPEFKIKKSSTLIDDVEKVFWRTSIPIPKKHPQEKSDFEVAIFNGDEGIQNFSMYFGKAFPEDLSFEFLREIEPRIVPLSLQEFISFSFKELKLKNTFIPLGLSFEGIFPVSFKIVKDFFFSKEIIISGSIVPSITFSGTKNYIVKIR